MNHLFHPSNSVGLNRMMTVYINKKPISFQVSMDAAVRFSHLNEKEVTDGTQLEIQRWDKLHMAKRKNQNLQYRKLFIL